MELSVYISNERIEIVAGTGSKSKAKIKKVYSKCNVLIALSDEWKERLSQIVPEDYEWYHYRRTAITGET